MNFKFPLYTCQLCGKESPLIMRMSKVDKREGCFTCALKRHEMLSREIKKAIKQSVRGKTK